MRLGFVGVGWIGRHRMRALRDSGLVSAAVVADASPEAAAEAAAELPGARVASPEEVLGGADLGLDGVVIATPSALHAEQAVAALESGLAVFCQKPLGRTAAETADVVEAARRADRLLDVDLSYRHLAATDALRAQLAGGALGRVFAADLLFHNAYGPDKPWFRDPRLAGGGCVVDLGTHLVDLALWLLGGPPVERVEARLLAGGVPLDGRTDVVEDYAVARLDLAGGVTATLACSWNLHAGRPARIGATFYGTGGAVELANVGGSFYDFRAVRHEGTSSRVLVEPPDDWGGRAAVSWARRLAGGAGFDPDSAGLVATAAVLDRVYGR